MTYKSNKDVILTLAGAEASIGLALLIIFYRIRGLIAVNFVRSLSISSILFIAKKTKYDKNKNSNSF